jgi:uncharacterized protein YdhG (YjbR/CyaY superfamily)
MLSVILPQGEEAISYSVPAVMIEGKAIAGYSYSKGHCSYFPHSGSVLAAIDQGLLDGYDWSKGTLRFATDQPPEESLIRELVEARLALLDR